MFGTKSYSFLLEQYPQARSALLEFLEFFYQFEYLAVETQRSAADVWSEASGKLSLLLLLQEMEGMHACQHPLVPGCHFIVRLGGRFC